MAKRTKKTIPYNNVYDKEVNTFISKNDVVLNYINTDHGYIGWLETNPNDKRIATTVAHLLRLFKLL